MIIARNTITLAHVTDIASVTWYYKLQASTATKPAKPTTDPPTGWTDTEPAYTEGSTNSLYVCEKTVFTDGTFVYSEVSLSSSYEAAKLAYNKSVAAKTAADQALEQSVEYIVGTQTGATGSWTGTTLDSELKPGKTIAYKLPYAGSGSASLTLTLADGSKTAAIPVYSNTTRVTTHFGANSVITMTYDGQYWRAAGAAPSNSNNYDRRLHNNPIKAASAVTAKHLIAGTVNGYKNIDASLEFDLSYPILYASAAINAGATNNATYEAIPSVDFSITGAIESGAAAKMLYLKGTVDGSTFTVASNSWLTTAIPAQADGMYYIPLGVMTSATNGYFSSSNRLYAFIDGKFQAADVAGIILANQAQYDIDNLTIGGRNLLLDSGEEKTSAAYNSRAFLLSDEGQKLADGDIVTFTMKAKVAADRTQWAIFNSGGSVAVTTWQNITADGVTEAVYTWSGPWKVINGSYTADNKSVRVYFKPSAATSDNTIYWAKLERGNKSTDWTPAPEDTSAEIREFDRSLDQQEIFNRLTHNGEEQGFYLENDKLYLNFEYAVGQTLKIGGSNNKNGVIKLYDDDDNEWGSWSNGGLSMASGSSSVKLSPFSLQFNETSHGYLQRSSVYGGVFTTGFVDASTGNIEFGVDIGSYLTSDPNAPFVFMISAEAVSGGVECGFVLDPYGDTDLVKVVGPTLFHDSIRFEAGTGAIVGVSPQTDIDSTAIYLDDNAGTLVGMISSRYQTTGEVGLGLDAVRRLTNGTLKRSDLRILIDDTGNTTVHTSDQMAWRQGLGIRYGSAASAVSIPSGSYADRTYSFGHTFSSVPTVFISLTGSGDNAYRGDVTATVKAVTATDVAVRFYNASAATLNVGLNWLAIGNDA